MRGVNSEARARQPAGAPARPHRRPQGGAGPAVPLRDDARVPRRLRAARPRRSAEGRGRAGRARAREARRRRPPSTWPKLRLNKILAQAGLTSRRGAERLSSTAASPSTASVPRARRRSPTPSRRHHRRRPARCRRAEAHRYMLLNKPRGYVTTARDPQGRPVVTDLVPARRARLYPVGRLDGDVEGALLLTNDGTLTHRLLHPALRGAARLRGRGGGRVGRERPAAMAARRRRSTRAGGAARRVELLARAGRGRRRVRADVRGRAQARGQALLRGARAIRVAAARRVAFGPLRARRRPAPAGGARAR